MALCPPPLMPLCSDVHKALACTKVIFLKFFPSIYPSAHPSIHLPSFLVALAQRQYSPHRAILLSFFFFFECSKVAECNCFKEKSSHKQCFIVFLYDCLLRLEYKCSAVHHSLDCMVSVNTFLVFFFFLRMKINFFTRPENQRLSANTEHSLLHLY